MKLVAALLLLTTVVCTVDISAEVVPVGASILAAQSVPNGGAEIKDGWGYDKPAYRRKFTIRPSESDTDDISADFLVSLILYKVVIFELSNNH